MSAQIEFFKGDITKVVADAIVNAANTTLLGGGGVDGAIHRASGPKLLAECAMLGGCRTGEAKITKGYSLLSRHVIHTVGPVWKDGKHREPELLASCYRRSLELAKAHSLHTVAFPSISTGAYRFPVEQAAAIAVKTVMDFFAEGPGSVQKVIFVLFSDRDHEVYRRAHAGAS